MSESISRLVDGELGDDELETVCGRLRRPDEVTTWVCYHVIGDTLRGSGVPRPGFSARFSARLAAEPTILVPGARRSRPVPMAWAVAATVAAVTVVGWVAVATLEISPTAMAKSREAAVVSAAQVRPPAVPADYLLAHREYSPTAQIQGVGPNLRAVAASTDVGP